MGLGLSAIRLDSTLNLVIVVVLTLLAIIAVPFLWERWRRKVLGRSTTILVAVVLIVVSTGMGGNMIGKFFPTVGALFGTGVYSGENTDAVAGENGSDLDKLRDAGAMRAKEGKGSVVHMTVTGKRTGLTRDVSVYFPPQYYDPAYRALKFPVIEWIPNYPSGPEVVTGPYELPAKLDAAIAKHVLPPTLVVIPDPTGKPKVGHDTECIDQVNGTANDTYLSADIRDWAIEKLGANPQRKAWTMAGWSSGGYCAMNLVTRHPQWYGQAASVSGYYKASVDAETENLFKGRQDIVDANTITVNMQKHPSPVDILAIAGDKESFESFSIDQLQAAVRAPATLSSWRIADAGHNMNTFKAQVPDVLAWIGARTVPPSAPQDKKIVSNGGVTPWPLPNTGAKGALVDVVE
ncbi:esterase family protein [Amycolatopsis sp. BJA-103]|uniref:alpha/beta hydrolase n=1 Tax=Amycolatopsis sp. BJA-103 TaxID=1911175 RepID=UPI000C76E949|nr:alpha/beta hydrolase-fold protein [Amycolatopsis sp. BJA-103]AUI64927.1 esterase [Amycolatopsis sp. BJA-103]PNE19680.1 esterase [Amycolatopsis sp. BJA-103]